MPFPKLFTGLIYFQSKFQWDVGESWNNVSVIFQKISKKILKTVNWWGGENRHALPCVKTLSSYNSYITIQYIVIGKSVKQQPYNKCYYQSISAN